MTLAARTPPEPSSGAGNRALGRAASGVQVIGAKSCATAMPDDHPPPSEAEGWWHPRFRVHRGGRRGVRRLDLGTAKSIATRLDFSRVFIDGGTSRIHPAIGATRRFAPLVSPRRLIGPQASHSRLPGRIRHCGAESLRISHSHTDHEKHLSRRSTLHSAFG